MLTLFRLKTEPFEDAARGKGLYQGKLTLFKPMILCCRFMIVGCLVLLGGTVRADIGMISPEEAKRLIEASDPNQRPIVIDTRGGYKDYFRGHLPRAHHLNFDTLRGTDQGVPVQYLPRELMVPLLKRAGAHKDRLHILYATGDRLPNDEILSSSMVAYVLEKYGIRNIGILDGGYPAWAAAGLPVTQEYHGNPEGVLPELENLQIAANVQDVLHRKPDTLLVDARPMEEFLGDDQLWLRKGHIPGAISFHWAKLMEEDNTHKFRSREANQAALEAAGITREKDIIVYCGTSREGSLLRFYLCHVLGYANVRLYEGSWKEYVAMKELPVERGPGGRR